MQTPAQRCTRIVAALEDLVAQETVALANHDYAAVLTLQERTAPLVDFIVTNGAAYVTAPELRARLDLLQRRRGQNSASLTAEIERARTEFQETCVAQRRVASVAPAYAKTVKATSQRLQAVG
jgi:hypothetical protein